jgi:hypothetical protein
MHFKPKFNWPQYLGLKAKFWIGKCQCLPYACPEGTKGASGMVPLGFNLCIGWKWVIKYRLRPLYSRLKSPWYIWSRTLGGPQSRSWWFCGMTKFEVNEQVARRSSRGEDHVDVNIRKKCDGAKLKYTCVKKPTANWFLLLWQWIWYLIMSRNLNDHSIFKNGPTSCS